MKRLLAAVFLVVSIGVGIGVADAASTTTTVTLSSGQSALVTCAGGGRLTHSSSASSSLTALCHAPDTTSTTSTTTTTTVAPTSTTTTTTMADPPPETSTTTTTTQPPGGTCTNPSWSSSNPEDTDNTDPNDGAQYWWVDNDAWAGSAGPQTISVCSQSSWYAVSDQPNIGGQVETYPDTEYDVGGRDNPSTTPISGFTSITSTFSEDYPSAGGWDAAYDLWTDDWTNETMIWNQWSGDNSFWADCAESSDPMSYCGVPQNGSLTLDGVPYYFLANGPGTDCTVSNESQCELMFFRATQTNSGSVDILAAFQWEVAHGYAKASDVPTQLEYGVEISYTSGDETFPMNGLTFSLSS